MKNVGNSAGNGLHITKDKKPLASTPLRKHNFNFGFKMLQVRLSEGNSKRRRKGIFSSQVICIKSKGRMITDQVHYCVNAHCTYFTVHIFSSKQPKQPCVCPAFYAKSVHQEFPWKKKKRNGSRWCRLVFETSSCNKRAREGRGSKNSSQPSEEIAVGRELLSRNVLTFSNFSCFPFPPLHRIDLYHPHHRDLREETN